MRRDKLSCASFAEEVQSEFARYQHNCRDFSRYATQHPRSRPRCLLLWPREEQLRAGPVIEYQRQRPGDIPTVHRSALAND